jgi:hypothetical protein
MRACAYVNIVFGLRRNNIIYAYQLTMMTTNIHIFDDDSLMIPTTAPVIKKGVTTCSASNGNPQ